MHNLKQLLFCFSLLVLNLPGLCAGGDSLMIQLSRIIKQSPEFDKTRMEEISRLKQSMPAAGKPLSATFDQYRAICEAYKTFNYDSAYSYAMKGIQVARAMNDQASIAEAQLNLCFILLSAGLYKETTDSLHSLSTRPVPDALKGNYFALWGRYYYDLAGYAGDNYHSVDYDLKGNSYLDSALAYFDKNSFEYNYYSGLKNFKQNKRQDAAAFFSKLLADPRLDQHQLALTASTYSAVYLQEGDIDKAIDLLIQATMADIRSSTKETVAIFHLSELLYKKGDLKHAAMCIENAVSNAAFYGARQRKLQASSILPLIEGERINGIEAQKNLLIKYAVVVTILVVALLVLAWIVLKQVKQLKRAQQALEQANRQQHVINKQLEETNRQLAQVNDQLQEANKIKEEYIGYFFDVDSEFYSKLAKVKNTIEQKLQERRYDDIRFFLNKIDTRREKEELLLSFDKIFVKLFPNFVRDVNALLRKEEQIVLKDGELLTTDLRIFALMRMGVTDPEKIARILEYSVKTIYSYKSRIKNKASIPGDDFEEKVMQIKG
jgi:large-conductance mechanosensitive channel